MPDRFLDRILDLPAPVRVMLFAVVVLSVFALGYLTLRPNDTDTNKEQPNTAAATAVADPALNGAPEEGAQFESDPTKGVELELSMPVSEDEIRAVAGRGVQFAELFLSYRYDQNKARKQGAIERLLAPENTIEVSKIFPAGDAAADLKTSQTVIGVRVTRAEVVLIAQQSLVLTLSVETTTTTTAGAQSPNTTDYSMTLSRPSSASDSALWGVVDFAPLADTDLHGEG